MHSSSRPASSGFRPLRVIARTAETARVTSFWLEPVEPEGWRPFLAGQFLSFRLPSTDERGKMLRNYSLASAPHETGRYRICVKRERPAESATGGQGSGYFHDQAPVGAVLYADGPRGNFILKDSAGPALLVSADIGVTPLVSMLGALAPTDRPVIFVHECEDAAQHILRADVEALAARRSGIALHCAYRALGRMVDATMIAALLPAQPCDVYLCGPTPFMQRAYAALRRNGVPRERIAHEFFGPLIDLERDFLAGPHAAGR